MISLHRLQKQIPTAWWIRRADIKGSFFPSKVCKHVRVRYIPDVSCRSLQCAYIYQYYYYKNSDEYTPLCRILLKHVKTSLHLISIFRWYCILDVYLLNDRPHVELLQQRRRWVFLQVAGDVSVLQNKQTFRNLIRYYVCSRFKLCTTSTINIYII